MVRYTDSRRRRTDGFTLIELAVVMVIIALMASSLLFAMFQVQQTAKVSRTIPSSSYTHAQCAMPSPGWDFTTSIVGWSRSMARGGQ